MSTNAHDPAFSTDIGGLSKRELFALVFMAALLSRPGDDCCSDTAAHLACEAVVDFIAELNGWTREESLREVEP